MLSVTPCNCLFHWFLEFSSYLKVTFINCPDVVWLSNVRKTFETLLLGGEKGPCGLWRFHGAVWRLVKARCEVNVRAEFHDPTPSISPHHNQLGGCAARSAHITLLFHSRKKLMWIYNQCKTDLFCLLLEFLGRLSIVGG